MLTKITDQQIFGFLLISCLVLSFGNAEDYDAEAETSISGLGGLSGLSGLSALANGVVGAYAPMSGGAEIEDGGAESSSDDGSDSGGDRGAETTAVDYDEDSNDSSASEEHPILSKFMTLISGGRRKRSVDNADVPKTLNRVKRGYKGWVPYVKTYVKTDKKANFKWGVKAKVGKKYGK